MEQISFEPKADQVHPSRIAWKMLEPYHAMIYFVPEAREAFTAAGLKGYWMGYFASRAAPLGAASPELITATFYNFHPRMVRKAIPDAWRFSNPEKIIATRLGAADSALRRLLGEELIASAEIAEAAKLAQQALEGCNLAGRALFAGYCGLEWPNDPHLILWHAATLLREYRGDGHVAALMTSGVDGCEAHLTLIGDGVASRETLQPSRGWNDEEWEAAHARLMDRGLLDETGKLTPAGKQVRQQVEDLTDRLAFAPWQHLGETGYNRLLQLMYPISGRIIEQKGIPVPNPMGVEWP
jgi:hypothetical protein